MTSPDFADLREAGGSRPLLHLRESTTTSRPSPPLSPEHEGRAHADALWLRHERRSWFATGTLRSDLVHPLQSWDPAIVDSYRRVVAVNQQLCAE